MHLHIRRLQGIRSLSLAVGILVLAVSAPADEGMWLFTNPPVELLGERYGFTPEPAWLDHLMRAAVDFSGASGSFVSPDGLILTNHHVGADAIYKLSTAERDLLANGFVARTRGEELRAPGLEVHSLVAIVDVTGQVQGAVPAHATPAEARRAREQAIARIEQRSTEETGLRSEVVTLYRGGLYHLYRYKRYDDVRLVMAPEQAVAFFGGDRDNFEYPRYDLDISIFRAYEDGRPARIEHYLTVAGAPLAEGELIFAVGQPGSTGRLTTLDHLRFYRDVLYPHSVALLAGREIALQQFSMRNAEFARMAHDDLLGIENGRKSLLGRVAGLCEPELMGRKAESEALLRARVAEDPELGATLEDWTRLSGALDAYRGFVAEYRLLEEGRGFWSDLFGVARKLVRLAEERAKPNEERLPGYREADFESVEHELFSETPVYPELEEAKLAHSLAYLAMSFGGDHPLVRELLQGRSPERRAAELAQGTRLYAVGVRRALADGGPAAIQASGDPMIVLARTVEPYARAVRERYEDWMESVERTSYERISRALFAEYGTRLYPDATGTLRLAFGPVRGVHLPDEEIPFATTLGGAYGKHDEAGGRAPYTLPARWLAARGEIDPAVQLNFVSTADITGGNSGSPVVDRAGNLVGVIFDSNLAALASDFAYTEERARSVSVAAAAILEALRKIYAAPHLAEEMEGRR